MVKSIDVMSVMANAGFEVASVTPHLPRPLKQCQPWGGLGGSYNVTLVTPSSNCVGPIEPGANVTLKVEPFKGPAAVRVSGTITLKGKWTGATLSLMIWDVEGNNLTAATTRGAEDVYRYFVTLPNKGTYGYQVLSPSGVCEPGPLTLYSRTPDFTFDVICGQ